MQQASTMAANTVTAAQNKAALDYLIQMPVTRGMVSYLASKASSVIRCEQQRSPVQPTYLPPTPPSTPPSSAPSSPLEPMLPTVEAFITSIVQQSHVGVQTLMPTLVYLSRLQQKLPPVAKGMRCTVHRIFLATLILSAKNLNDSSPKNKYWARYTSVPGFENFGFSNSEVNLMERQLLFLLDWDLRITTEDLYTHLEPFLAPIRVWQQRQAEKAMQTMVAEREIKQQQLLHHQQQHINLTNLMNARRGRIERPVYDSPRSVSSYSDSTYSSRHRPYFSRSSSRLPSRTPSLSPPTRTGSAASSTYTASIATTSPITRSSTYEQIRIEPSDTENLPPVVHIPAPAYTPSGHKVYHSLSSSTSSSYYDSEKPAKKLKTTSGNIFSRILSNATSVYAPRTALQQLQQGQAVGSVC